MRKSCLSILLACLLALAQLGAFVHEIGHHGDAVEARHEQGQDQAADSLCALCLAFAQLAAIARPAPLVVTPATGVHEMAASRLPQGRSVRVARGRNRDPPPPAA